ncbi:hypothetical protein ACFQZT_30640 [Paenibacillus sp. GCM10027628]|uniref:hypothetical protein n=1 Tax=Paenibacillus sp. GCM10027628 TaxID=3273413 RepID=UPI003644BBCD
MEAAGDVCRSDQRHHTAYRPIRSLRGDDRRSLREPTWPEGRIAKRIAIRQNKKIRLARSLTQPKLLKPAAIITPKAGKIQAYMNELAAQSGKALTEAQAKLLIHLARLLQN